MSTALHKLRAMEIWGRQRGATLSRSGLMELIKLKIYGGLWARFSKGAELRGIVPSEIRPDSYSERGFPRKPHETLVTLLPFLLNWIFSPSEKNYQHFLCRVDLFFPGDTGLMTQNFRRLAS